MRCGVRCGVPAQRGFRPIPAVAHPNPAVHCHPFRRAFRRALHLPTALIPTRTPTLACLLVQKVGMDSNRRMSSSRPSLGGGRGRR